MVLRIFLLILMMVSTASLPHFHGSDGVVIKEAYLNWIKQMGTLRHSLFKKAKNKHKPCLTITVAKHHGAGDFESIQKAIDSVPDLNHCRVVISIHSGTYKEKVDIPATKPYISLLGAGAGKTVIQWGDTADRIGRNGKPLGTFASATVAVNAPYFIAKNITFKNTAPLPPSGALGKQAVALRISADTAAFVGCKFHGAQDTLYDHKGRHYFKECYIEGSIDFIFGDGHSLYESCHLHAITNTYGALTAQKRESLLEETGFSFTNCKVTGSGALYLGRAWGTFSRVVFAYTYMDKIITPKGWYNWGDRNREMEKGIGILYTMTQNGFPDNLNCDMIMTVFYGQYKCSGPGADYEGRVSWSRELTPQEAKPFISLSFIDGHEWLDL